MTEAAAPSVQPVQRPTAAFVGASWAALFLGAGVYGVGLWNVTLALSEKGFYAMRFAPALFGAVAVQKNVRDTALAPAAPRPPRPSRDV